MDVNKFDKRYNPKLVWLFCLPITFCPIVGFAQHLTIFR